MLCKKSKMCAAKSLKCAQLYALCKIMTGPRCITVQSLSRAAMIPDPGKVHHMFCATGLMLYICVYIKTTT
jgi:hypothetical protein